MHILLIHQAFTSIEEPGGTRHHEIAQQLVEMGQKVTVITGQVSYLTGQSTADTGWVYREVDDRGVEILRTYSYQKWHRSFFHRMFSFISFMISSFIVGLRIRQVDVVWGTTPPLFQGLSAWVLARLKGAKFLFEVRDLWPKFAVAVGVLRNPVLIWLSKCLERFLYRRADNLVVNSPGFLEHVFKHGAKSVVVIPNGVDVKMFSDGIRIDSQTVNEELDGKFVALYAGAHGEANDLKVVLDAASRLRDEDQIRFVFIGDGKEKSALVAYAAEHGLDNVLFSSPVSKREMPQVLATADICLAILKPVEEFKTTYPNKVFDYMAAGKPVVLAIDGVIRKVIEEAEAGVFVPPGDPIALADAVIELWQNPRTVEKMGLAGREVVSARFDRSKQVGAFAELLQEMVS
jgi:glycosyltransferase involved in cell wall biosynthesis